MTCFDPFFLLTSDIRDRCQVNFLPPPSSRKDGKFGISVRPSNHQKDPLAGHHQHLQKLGLPASLLLKTELGK